MFLSILQDTVSSKWPFLWYLPWFHLATFTVFSFVYLCKFHYLFTQINPYFYSLGAASYFNLKIVSIPSPKPGTQQTWGRGLLNEQMNKQSIRGMYTPMRMINQWQEHSLYSISLHLKILNSWQYAYNWYSWSHITLIFNINVKPVKQSNCNVYYVSPRTRN